MPFLKGKKGTAAVEFTLIAIPFLGLLFAIVETGLVFLFELTIANTSQHVARIIATGQLQQAGVASADRLKTQFLCPAVGARLLPAFVSCDRLFIDVRTSDSFKNSIVSNDFYSATSHRQFCPGGPSSIVVVRLAYALPVFLPALALVQGTIFGVSRAGLVDDVPGFSGWNHLIAHADVFQNEPFTTSSSSACG